MDAAKPSNNPILTGQVAVITGAGRGIGAAIATEIASMGARTVLCGRTRQHLHSTAAAISRAGGRAEPLECDVTNLPSVEAAAAHVEQTLGRARRSGQQCGHWRLRGPAPPDAAGFLGCGVEY